MKDLPPLTVPREPDLPAPRVPATDGRRYFGVVVLIGVVLIGGAFAADPLVTRWTNQERFAPLLARLFGRSDSTNPLLDQLFPLLIILAILFALPYGAQRCAGLLAPILLHLPLLHLVKWGIGRMRPMADLGAYTFWPFSGAKYADAFPSGHAALPAIVALVLGVNFPRARWVFYAWAGAEGLKRIVYRPDYVGVLVPPWHHLSDVLAGYLLAYVVVSLCQRVWPLAYPTSPRCHSEPSRAAAK